VIVAIHDLNLAAALADRAILLSQGKVAMDAPTESVLMSDRLDEAFGATFDRLRTPAGRLVVVPQLSGP
jgi:iron complex transport system ATP-binding protein